MDILDTSFDLYTRYFLIAGLIERIRSKTQMKILDAGGGGSLLGTFLRQDIIVVINISPLTVKTSDSYILGDITNAPFENQSFDLVISSDCYEHIPPDKRAEAISEMLRLSKNFVVLGAPFYSLEVYEAEMIANNFWLKATGEPHRFLKEHINNTLPGEKEFELALKQRGYEFYKLGTNNLTTWFMLVLFSFYSDISQILRDKIAVVWRFYNDNFVDLGDFEEPTYRKIYLIGKHGTLPQIDLGKNGRIDRLKQQKLISLVFNAIHEDSALKVSQIKNFEARLRDEDSQVNELNIALRARDMQISELNTSLRLRDDKIRNQDLQIFDLERQIDQSIIMNLLIRFQRVVDKVLPQQTLGRRLYEKLLSGIRIVLCGVFHLPRPLRERN